MFTYFLIVGVFTFFFSQYPHPRHLHSFPTRRSSDLDQRGFEPGTRWQRRWQAKQVGRCGTATSDRREWSERRQVPRSEEHTSELQSRFDLVCRLLLEKKKKKKMTNIKKIKIQKIQQR